MVYFILQTLFEKKTLFPGSSRYTHAHMNKLLLVIQLHKIPTIKSSKLAHENGNDTAESNSFSLNVEDEKV